MPLLFADALTGSREGSVCFGPPQDDAEGAWTFSDGDYHLSQADYACNTAGFKATGDASIVCQAPTVDSVWPSASVACERMLQLPQPTCSSQRMQSLSVATSLSTQPTERGPSMVRSDGCRALP